MKRKAKNCSHCLRCIACAGRHEIAIWPEALTDVVQRPIAPKKQKTHSTLKNNASNQSPESLHKLQDGCCAVTDFVHCHMHVKCSKHRQSTATGGAEDLHKHQNNRRAVTDVVHRRIVQDRRGIQGRSRCGNDNGYAGQEQQRAGRLVYCCAELLCRVLVPPDQEAAACRKKKG